MVHFDEIISSVVFGVLLVLEAIIRCVVYPLSLYRYLRSEKTLLPPVQDDTILMKSATFLAKKIRSGELKSEDVVKEYIKRLKEVNNHLNAVVEDRFTEVLEESQKVDELIASNARYSNQLGSEMPFLGVPITVKESCQIKGMSYCVGSIVRRGVKAEDNGECVKNMKLAGAIPIAVTTTPEWCSSFETNNLVTGKTLNPYDKLRTPGGSSGGEAALLGSAASVCGIGSDIAGSIRVPSLFTGIFGHKPTPGYIPIDGHFPNCPHPKFKKFLVVGPMCRYVEDLLPMTNAMAGKDASKLRLDEKVEVNTLKIYYAVEAGSSKLGLSVDTQIKDAIMKAVNYLHDVHGSTIIEKSYYVFIEAVKALFGCSLFSLQALYIPLIKSIVSIVPKTSIDRYLKQGEELEKKIMETLGMDGVFIYPSHPTLASRHGEVYGKLSATMYSMIFNIMGMPATQVPMGISSSGLPIGFQVVAAPHQDRLCLAVARVLGEKFGGWVPPPTSQTSSTI